MKICKCKKYFTNDLKYMGFFKHPCLYCTVLWYVSFDSFSLALNQMLFLERGHQSMYPGKLLTVFCWRQDMCLLKDTHLCPSLIGEVICGLFYCFNVLLSPHHFFGQGAVWQSWFQGWMKPWGINIVKGCPWEILLDPIGWGTFDGLVKKKDGEVQEF